MAHTYQKLPDDGDPALAALVGRFMVTIHLLESRAQENEALALMNESGLTLPQIIALHVLKMHGVHTVGDLATETRLSKAATSQMVDRLVALGYVTRAEDERDRRQKQIALTPRGSDLMDRVFEGRFRMLRGGFSQLAPATRERLMAVLAEVCRDLGHDPDCCPHAKTGEER